ncbi:WD40-repeat-containing domain protein [Syncephalis plumigaleata]|nr:WD40-repeat-containing domain protein [Syncephalis plumigaleata]
MPPRPASSEPTHVHGLRHQVRCLTALPASEERALFLTATWSPRSDNEIHLVEVDEEQAKPLRTRVFQHDAAIWHMAGHPKQLALAACCEDRPVGAQQRPVKLIAIPGIEANGTSTTEATTDEAIPIATTSLPSNRSTKSVDEDDPTTAGITQCLVWEPLHGNQLCTVESDRLRLWSWKEGDSLTLTSTLSPPNDDDTANGSSINRHAAWSRHRSTVVSVDGSTIRGWDTRHNKSTYTVPLAHDGAIRAIDCNPNVPHRFATGGDDGIARIWDARKLQHPWMELSGHTHWIWSIAYHPMHDQLILTGGSDAHVNLQSAVTMSSAAFGSGDPEEDASDWSSGEEAALAMNSPATAIAISNTLQLPTASPLGAVPLSRRSSSRRPTDGLVKSFTDHDDSVYGVAWSPANPWLIASISYSGRLVMSYVPSEEKYKILL